MRNGLSKETETATEEGWESIGYTRKGNNSVSMYHYGGSSSSSSFRVPPPNTKLMATAHSAGATNMAVVIQQSGGSSSSSSNNTSGGGKKSMTSANAFAAFTDEVRSAKRQAHLEAKRREMERKKEELREMRQKQFEASRTKAWADYSSDEDDTAGVNDVRVEDEISSLSSESEDDDSSQSDDDNQTQQQREDNNHLQSQKTTSATGGTDAAPDRCKLKNKDKQMDDLDKLLQEMTLVEKSAPPPAQTEAEGNCSGTTASEMVGKETAETAGGVVSSSDVKVEKKKQRSKKKKETGASGKETETAETATGVDVEESTTVVLSPEQIREQMRQRAMAVANQKRSGGLSGVAAAEAKRKSALKRKNASKDKPAYERNQ